MKYGFIGCGNMGSAIARALSEATKDILISDRSGKARSVAEELGCVYGSVSQAADCEYVFLGVKPQMMSQVLEQLRPQLQRRQPVLISMAAGLKTSAIADMAGGNLPVIRIMPNTPVAVGRGVIEYCCNGLVTPAALAKVLQDLQAAGLLDAVEEPLMDAACSVSGCGPAFAYLFLEALAQGGVDCGLPREQALKYAAETLAGAAEMVRRSSKTPQELCNNVCSPGGSTLEGVRVLQQQDLQGIVRSCVEAAFRRNQELGK